MRNNYLTYFLLCAAFVFVACGANLHSADTWLITLRSKAVVKAEPRTEGEP